MKLPKFLLQNIKEHNTSLGINDAFPPEEDYPFEYKLACKRYEEVCDNLQLLEINQKNTKDLKSYLSELLKKCKELEEPIKDNLVKICENYVNKALATPSETIILTCKLVETVEPKKDSYRLMPENSDNREFDFNDLNDFGNASKVIMKRRLINSLIQGVSHHCNEYCGNGMTKEISNLNSDLPRLYDEIMIINDYLLFAEKENITDKKPSQGAYVDVTLGGEGEKTEIYVQGLIFPYLLQEAFRGFFELFASHGLPKDNGKAKYIISQADFLLAEPWDMRLGVPLWNIINEKINDSKILPYLFTALCEMQVEDFNENMKEVFAKTKRGKQFINGLIKESEHMVEMNSFIDTIKQKNAEHSLITDEYIGVDELDGYELNETIIDEALHSFDKQYDLAEEIETVVYYMIQNNYNRYVYGIKTENNILKKVKININKWEYNDVGGKIKTSNNADFPCEIFINVNEENLNDVLQRLFNRWIGFYYSS